jgi:hypothetical protein
MQRSIQFWRVINSSGTDLEGTFPAAQLVKMLSEAEAANLDRHRLCRNGMTVIAHAAGQSPYPTLLLDKVRRENYPSVGDRAGRRQPMRLQDGEGLLEPTYFSFLGNNVVAALVNGNGPHPQRLAEYVRTKFHTPIGLVPVLRRDLDAVLREMRFTEIEVAVPAERLDRDLVGGDWVEALDGARSLSHDGVLRIGLSVGQKGDAFYKASFSDHVRSLVDQVRQATGFGDLTTARVVGRVRGNRQVIDLINDKFVERVDVDPDKFGDPDQATNHAKEVLASAAEKTAEYLKGTLASAAKDYVDLGEFDEAVDDEQPARQD